ncbi:MAG: hypothetical protein ACYSU5_25030 [Planctomycetota bacterium]|jgi:hypothetical protein
MLKNNGFLRPKTAFALLLLAVICRTAVAGADRTNWKRQEVDLRMTGGSRIKAILRINPRHNSVKEPTTGQNVCAKRFSLPKQPPNWHR